MVGLLVTCPPIDQTRHESRTEDVVDFCVSHVRPIRVGHAETRGDGVERDTERPIWPYLLAYRRIVLICLSAVSVRSP